MSLIKKSVANFIGGVIPAIASILTVPVIVARLGETQYGLFTLVTAIVGYFALIDINVTAGSVKYLAEHHARNEQEQVNKVVSFGGLIYFIIGLIGGLGIFFFSDLLVTTFFKVPTDLHETARKTLQFASVAFFFGQMQVYLLSVPQALQRYDLTGKIESFFGALTSISTVAVVLLGGGLVEIIFVRLVLSVINCGLLVNIIIKILPFLKLVKPDRVTVKKLASFSGYSYLSRIAAISYANGDKLLIGALININAVAIFSVPSLLVNRVSVPLYRLGTVLFPVSSALAANNQHDELRRVYLVSVRYYTYLHASLSLLLSFFSRELLHYWAGPKFGSDAALILVIIATATFINSLTNLPSLLNDGLGKPKYTGIFAALYAVFGILSCYIGIKTGGIIGAAWAELFTTIVFASVFVIFVHVRVLPIKLREVYWESYHPTLMPIITLLSISAILSQHPVLTLPWFFIKAIIIITILLTYGWFIICLPKHRKSLKEFTLRHLTL